MHPNHNNTKKAFTLIELSIAMLILGLLIAGVLVASKMVNSAKLRKIIKERDQLEQAIIDFKVQYGALPGSQSMYEQIKDYPELGVVRSYYNMLNYGGNTSTFVNTNKDKVISQVLIMPANGMLQMTKSSNGSYPNITATSVTGSISNAKGSIHPSSYSGAYWSYGYPAYLPSTGQTNLGWISTTMLALVNSYAGATGSSPISSIPSNINAFINSHFITLIDFNGTNVGANFSVTDSVFLSKKYDTGKPNGEKMIFSPPRNTTGTCTTATTFGNLSKQIGPNTAFLMNSDKGIASKGCVIVFRASVDG
jgi:prepilin-type N-terminal cleavage/methylation domain-containing protein